MKQFRIFSIALVGLALVLSGCQHKFEEVKLDSNLSKPKLDTSAGVYVALPSAVRYKGELVLQSSQAAGTRLRDAFAKYSKRSYLGRKVETMEEAQDSAQKIRCAYFVFATIVRWEDHNTEFSGITDKVELKLEVADANTGEILHATLLKGKSRWMTDGDDKPQDLIQAPIENFVGSLFQVVQVPSALR